MTKRMPRTGAALLAIGLAIGGISGGMAFTANAASYTPARQVVASFDGNPDITDIQVDNNSDLRIVGLLPNEPVNILVSTATAADPATFSDQSGDWNFTATSQGFSGLHVGNTFHNDGTNAPLAAGDVLRFIITPATSAPIVYTYVIPATGGFTVTGNATTTLVNGSATFTGSEALAGIPITISGLDPTKLAVVETLVQYYGEVSNYTVIGRSYLTPVQIGSDGIIQTTVNAFSRVDDAVPLNAGDRVLIVSNSGAAISSDGLGVQIVGDTVTAAFTPINPTIAELSAGVPITFSQLDPSQNNTYTVELAKAATPTAFVYNSSGSIPGSGIVNGVATVPAVIIKDLDGSDLEGGDVVRILAENSSGGVFLAQDYVVDGGVVVPPVDPPVGAFDTAAPTADDFLTGTSYTFTSLDSTATNVAHVYAASAGAPTVFTEVGTVTIDAADIVGGAYTMTVSAYYAGTPNTSLNEGDVVEVRLVTNGAAEVVTSTYVIPGVVVVPGAPTGAFTSASPTAQELADGVSYLLTNLDPSVVNILGLQVMGPDETTFSTPVETTIPIGQIANGEYTALVEAYLSTDGGVTRSPLEAGSTIRITLSVDGGAATVLTDYVLPAVVVDPPTAFANCAAAAAAGRTNIPSTDPAYTAALDSDGDGIACESAGEGTLAQTGADDHAIQSASTLIIGGALMVGFMLVGVKLIRNRQDELSDVA